VLNVGWEIILDVLNYISSPPNSHSVKASLNQVWNFDLFELSEDTHPPHPTAVGRLCRQGRLNAVF
jgi:hypothetical protein